jgi:pyrimidine deaminase RibD-like protein
MSSIDRQYMERAVEEARRQAARYGRGEGNVRPDPLVGCVVVTCDGRVEGGYRGEGRKKDDHAEFIVLEEKLHNQGLKGATVFTTLEPCTDRRPGIVPCADRLVEAGVKRVFIGCMDPDDSGRGLDKLLDSGIEVQLFDQDLQGKIRDLNRCFIESRKSSSLRRSWFEEIEFACQHRVKVLADLAKAPRMNRIGEYPFPPELVLEYWRKRAENDLEHPGWRERMAEFQGLRRFGRILDYQDYDWVHWKTLRDAGRKPRAVYAGAVVVCPDRACVYIHKRGPRVEFPGKLHGFFGGFIVDYQNRSDDTLLHACLRELHEESSAQPTLDRSRIIIVENLDVGWIDVAFMAGPITRSNALRLKGSEEGEVVPLPFEQLEKQLVDNRDAWVSNGIAVHLIWLKLGAPGAPTWFQEKSQELYHRICERLCA